MMEPCCSRFTAAEGGARLAVAAGNQNTLAVEYASFISTRLIYEEAYKIRGSLSDGHKRSVYVARATRVQCVAYEINTMTDLSTVQALLYDDVYDWNAELETKQVLICTSEVFEQILREGILKMTDINVLVVDSCHRINKDDSLRYIMSLYKECEEENRPRILALTYPLYTLNKKEGTLQKNYENQNVEANELADSGKTDANCINEEDIIAYKEGEKEVKIEELLTDTKEDVVVELEKENSKLSGVKEENKEIKAERKEKELGEYENFDDFDMYEKLEWKIGELESELCSRMDFAEDIDGGKRVSASMTKPKELVIEYSSKPLLDTLPEDYVTLDKYMRETVQEAVKFLEDHRHDPTEIYGDELYEEFKNIPDPTIDPKNIFKQFLYVLEQLGPFAADKAAFSLLSTLEKLKIKVPYERHFLLLCLCTTVLVKIRCYADLVFSRHESDWEKISLYSSPKVMRFAEILEQFQPPDSYQKINDTHFRSPNTQKLLDDIEKCDFSGLGDKIEDRVNTYSANLKDLDDSGIAKSGDTQKLGSTQEVRSSLELRSSQDLRNSQEMRNTPELQNPHTFDCGLVGSHQKMLGFSRRTGHRLRGRGRLLRNNASRIQQLQLNPDALCGIVFLKEPFMAKIMFLVIVEISRCHPKLTYLCAQYCAVEHTEEPRECQRQGKKREEVLKKFRMHECNLLLATSALEEGIDLPRCNLVLRWDVPPSYRSYGLCRGRARAHRAAAGLMCSDTPVQVDTLLHNFATYRELDQVISRKCGCGIQNEPPQAEEDHADTLTHVIKPYTPLEVSNNEELSQYIKTNKGGVVCAEINSKTAFNKSEIKNSNIHNSSYNKNNNIINLTEETRTGDISKSNVGSQYAARLSISDASKQSRIGHVDNDLRTGTENEGEISKIVEVEDSKESGIQNDVNSIDSGEINVKEIVSIEIEEKLGRNNKSLDKEGVELFGNVTDHIKFVSTGDDMIDVCKKFDDIININEKAKKLNENLNIAGDEVDNNEKFQIDEDAVKDFINQDENLYCNKCNRMKTVNVECPCVINTDRSDVYEKISDDGDGINSTKCRIRSDSDGINPTKCGIRSDSDEINPTKCGIRSDSDEMSLTKCGIKSDSDGINTSECGFRDDSDGINASERGIKGSSDVINLSNCGIADSTKSIKCAIKGIRKCVREITDIGCADVDDSGVSDQMGSSASRIMGGGDEVCDSGIRNSNERISYDFKTDDGFASVDLSTAIALINRYCGKLPSDTFTRLAPQWWTEEVQLPTQAEMRTAYICTLRLPLNCPVKYNIVGHPMPTRVLARRMVALQACRILHKSGELDDHLMPIGKENFKSVEMESAHCTNESEMNDAARPGTTKRRQYYYKRTASAFTDCQPVVEPESGAEGRVGGVAGCGAKRNMLYAVVCRLWCALPERYNTRGRRLHAPQTATQAIGILMARTQPDSLQIPAFPVYTRSGEVRVSVELVPDADVRLSPRRGRLIRRFMRFVFADVLRVRRRGMKLHSEGSTHNNYYIVPTIKTTREDGTSKIDIDWSFLELIYQHTEEKKQTELEKPIFWHQDEDDDDEEVANEVAEKTNEDGNVKKLENPLLKNGETFVFDPEKYKEAVVTPWYRNQDQPQFFLVAEICWNLSPDSAFPSASHSSFRDYYQSKYGAALTQPDQPLLDVDHTSARLNLLTPRYVNRKGVALPVSSERTRRAKRDRLDQKQILVPELTRVHPFAAPLWFATVALPCVLYRINALLIADEIRRAVAIDVGLGVPKIDDTTMPGFQWPPLDFGWSLAEVLSADSVPKKKEADESRKELKEKDSRDKDEKESPLQEKEEVQTLPEEPKEKTINDILQEKEDAESGFEIGTWSNEMASSIPQSTEYDELMEPLPSNLTFCTSNSGGTNWCDPIERPKREFNPGRLYSMADSDCSYMSSDFDTDDSDLETDGSDEDTDTSGFWSGKNSNATMGVRIEYKTAHEAEAVDLERKTKVNPAPETDDVDDHLDKLEYDSFMRSGAAPREFIDNFRASVARHRDDIETRGLVRSTEPIREILPVTNNQKPVKRLPINPTIIDELFPYGSGGIESSNGQITVESVERNKRTLLTALRGGLSDEEIGRLNCFSMRDVDEERVKYVPGEERGFKPYYKDSGEGDGAWFDFDYQPNLEGHPGPSPSVILQALTMSNANDGINLERLETIGDSFLKFAITAYLYCAQPSVHEGKLSHMRSKQVSNLNLYRLGRNKRLGARMIASKFEPHDNWLPPCYKAPPTLHPRLASGTPESRDHGTNPAGASLDSAGCFIPYNLITQHSIPDKSIADCVEALIGAYLLECGPRGALLFMSWLGIRVLPQYDVPCSGLPATQADATPDAKPDIEHVKKATAESPKRNRQSSTSSECSSEEEEQPQEVEESEAEEEWWWRNRRVGSLKPYRDENGIWMQSVFGELKPPPSPLLRYIENPEGELEQMLSGYDALERTLEYRFKDRSLLLQALTHASHHKNRLTDCYQRLEFLGDAILDYLITRHLYEDPRRHCPGALTDLRSALVNNTIFATLAARHGFHKYFRHMSPGLNEVLTRYVKIQEENGHSISEEHYLIQEDEMEQAEDVEVPKALGDLFESVAGAIFLDSGMSLGAVWKSYVKLMGKELEAFSAAAPKSPVRELLEAEPDTAKFGKPERLADGRRVRVCVEVFGRGAFKGIGRNYRIAKGTAARCALRHLRLHKR